MAWITLTIDDVKAVLAGAEVEALQSAAIAVGQSDPVVEMIAEVTNEVRGYVAACEQNTLGAGATIPDKLKSAALKLVRYNSATRLPNSGLLDEDRKTAKSDAIRLLEQVAACKFAIDEPTEASDEVIATPTPSIAGNCRKFNQRTQDGI